MRLAVGLFCCLAFALSTYGLPLDSAAGGDEVKVTKLINRNNGDRYLMLFVLSDGTFRYERGYFKPTAEDTDEKVWTVVGRYRFRSPEGQLFSYKYSTADGGGFQQQAVNNSEDPLEVVNRIDPKALASLVG